MESHSNWFHRLPPDYRKTIIAHKWYGCLLRGLYDIPELVIKLIGISPGEGLNQLEPGAL